MYKAIEDGKINGDSNFFDYLIKQVKDEEMKKELQSYAKYNTWVRRLTVKEAQSIYAYTDGSGTIQKYLGTEKFESNPQRPDIDTEEKMIKTLKGIDKALEKGEILKENKIFYRGEYSDENLVNWKLPKNFEELKKKEGEVFTCKNYISTGVSKEGSFANEKSNSKIEWHIRCDAGKNYGAYVNEISLFYKAEDEYEFLIKRGANVKINKVWKEKEKIYIDASIVGFNPQKLE